MKSLLGLKFESNDFLDTWTNVFKNIHETKYQDLTLGLVCIVILLFLRVTSTAMINFKFSNYSDLILETKRYKTLSERV